MRSQKLRGAATIVVAVVILAMAGWWTVMRVVTVRTPRPPLAARLVARALVQERPTSAGDWDAAADLSISLRARIEVLRAGLGAAEQRSRILEQAKATAERILAYERPDPNGGRGWGTAKPIRLSGSEHYFDHVVDAYTTSFALTGLAELASWTIAEGDLAEARRIDAAVAPVLEYWMANMSFAAPGAGSAFEKMAGNHAVVRDFVIHNTDAVFARDLLVLADVASTLGDPARARAYREVATGIAARLVDMIVEPVLEHGPERWRYGVRRIGPDWTPLRQEDSYHASFILDSLSVMQEHGLVRPEQLRGLASLLPRTSFITGPEGMAALTIFIDPDKIQRDERGMRSAGEFDVARRRSRQREVATWWRSLVGKKRQVDVGTSVRKSWGWIEAARGDAALLAQIGRYLDAAETLDHGMSPGLFLSNAVWLRVTAQTGAN